MLEEVAKPDNAGLKLLREAAETMKLSARGYHRVLRVARTLADLDAAERVGRLHLAEASVVSRAGRGWAAGGVSAFADVRDLAKERSELYRSEKSGESDEREQGPPASP